MIRASVEEFSKVLSTKTVIGDPITIEDKIIIPVVKVGFGLGAGSGVGNGGKEQGEGYGSGVGGGGGVEAIAAIAIFSGVPGPEGIRVLPLKGPGIAQAIAEAIPACVAMFKEKKGQEAD